MIGQCRKWLTLKAHLLASLWGFFLSKGSNPEPVAQIKEWSSPVVCWVFFFGFFWPDLWTLVSAKTVVFTVLCLCENRTGETCLLFFTDGWDFFILGHQTKLRPVLSLAMSKKDGKETRCPVDTWRFLFFVPYTVLYMLASLCLSAIFNNQAIMMPSWFKQWYSLLSSRQTGNWMTDLLQSGG